MTLPVILTEDENAERLRRALSDITLSGTLDEDLTKTNKMRADLFNVVKEQFRGERISAVMVAAAGGLLKDIDDQYLKREKLDIAKDNSVASMEIAQAAMAFMAGGNPYLNPNYSKGPVDVDADAMASVDAAIPEIDPVEGHMHIGVETLDYDNYSPEGDGDEEDDDD